MTFTELRDELRLRLGDSDMSLWSNEELEGYLQEGYDALTLATGCLFSTAVLPDIAAAFTYVSSFEAAYVPASQYVIGPVTFTATFERDFADNGYGPANHNYPWEYYGWTELS